MFVQCYSILLFQHWLLGALPGSYVNCHCGDFGCMCFLWCRVLGFFFTSRPAPRSSRSSVRILAPPLANVSGNPRAGALAAELLMFGPQLQRKRENVFSDQCSSP